MIESGFCKSEENEVLECKMNVMDVHVEVNAVERPYYCDDAVVVTAAVDCSSTVLAW